MGLKDFFKDLAVSPTVLPHLIAVPDNNTDDPDGLAGPFEPHQHYFTVRVNEMFLAAERQWFKEIEPTVVCLTSYYYGDQVIDNPFLVDRSLIDAQKTYIPQGMVFNDTRVAGIHPFAGGRLTVSIVLCQSQTKDYLSDSLEFIQKISGVLSQNISALIGSYVGLAKIIIGSIDKLLDSKAVQPLFGFRKEFDLDANDRFSPGYFVMLEKSNQQWDPSRFFVRENHLFYGDDAATATAFREGEYVLFSITRSEERSDYQALPFYKSYKKILDELKASEISDGQKQKIKEMLRVLNIEMRQSPDLTEPHAQKLIQKFIDDVGKMIEPKFNWSAAPKKMKNDFWSKMDEKIVAL